MRAPIVVALLSLIACSNREPTEASKGPPDAGVTHGDASHGKDATNGPSDSGVDADDAGSAEFASVLAYLRKQMTTYNVPGASIAVVQNGKLTFEAGLGMKQNSASDLVTPTTLFTVASLSKMVLAATAMTLVEEGKLDTSLPVTTYVPLQLDSPFDPSTVTIHELLTHTSGLPDLDVDTTSCPVGPGQAAAWFGAHADEPLWYPPSDVWDYCNRGYSVMGWVIESITGAPYEDAATSRILGPAGMRTATFNPAQALATGPAFGHGYSSITGASLNPPAAVDCAVVRPPSGVIASVVDYAHFAEMLLASGGTVLQASSVATMETPFANTDSRPDGLYHYGYGLEIDNSHKGLHIIRHNGEVGFGYRTSLWLVPDRQFGVIVFYNATTANPDDVSEFAVDTFMGLTGVPETSYLTDASTWTQYEGTYNTPYNLGTLQVSLSGSNLLLSAPAFDAGKAQLVQVAGDSFGVVLGGTGVSVTFYPGPSGPAEWFVTREGVAARQ